MGRPIRSSLLVSSAAWIALALVPAAAAQVVYVDADAAGAADGTSWADAFPTLGAGLAAAGAGEQVWVAEGTYLPPVPGVGDPRSATFAIPFQVEVYGGFAGGETALAQRDPGAHPVILSGDLGTPGVAADNAYHVVTAGFGPARLDGVTVRDGRADGAASADRSGALLLANTSSLVAVDVVFASGHALAAGGAVSSANGHETFRRCTFSGNEANDGAGASLLNPQGTAFVSCTFRDNLGIGTAPEGGAIHSTGFFGATTVTLRGCVFAANASGSGGALRAVGAANFLDSVVVEGCAFTGNTGVHGGAISASVLDDLRLVGCRFDRNSVSNVGGAVALFNVDALVARCLFTGNATPHLGGALAATDLGSLTAIGSSPHVTDSLFTGNTADRGGAIFTNGASQPILSGCTLAGNAALDTGGAIHAEQLVGPFATGVPIVRVRSAVLWGNTDAGGSDETAQVHMAHGTLVLAHSDLEGLATFPGPGNVAADPLFVDLDGADGLLGTPDDDARLQPGSPCIDAGDSSSLLADAPDADCDGDSGEAQPLDLGGLRRTADDPATADTGAGGPPVVDMGAHEFGSTLPDDVWTDLGGGSPGVAGVPVLELAGTLCGLQTVELALADAAPAAPTLLWITTASSPFAALGGTVHAAPASVEFLLFTDGLGAIDLAASWPVGVPSAVDFTFQFLVQDLSVVDGITLSNGVRGTTP